MSSQREVTDYWMSGENIILEISPDGYAFLRDPTPWTRTLTPKHPDYEDYKRKLEDR